MHDPAGKEVVPNLTEKDALKLFKPMLICADIWFNLTYHLNSEIKDTNQYKPSSIFHNRPCIILKMDLQFKQYSFGYTSCVSNVSFMKAANAHTHTKKNEQ